VDLLRGVSRRKFHQQWPELPPEEKNQQSFRFVNPINQPCLYSWTMYLSTSTHINIYLVLISNTQNPKGREMFFQIEQLVLLGASWWHGGLLAWSE
jgi:hypothetical protein